MKRIPEPELMNERDQAEAYARADFSEPHNAFVKDFAHRFPGFSTGEILDLGCGSADVIIRFAQAFPDAMITGIDGSQAMLDFGHESIVKNGLTRRIRLRKSILPDIRLKEQTYDVIISNSLLHHLKDPSVLWNTVKDCSREGSLIFIMDLMRAESVEAAKELVRVHAAGEADILQEDFFNSLLAAYSPDEIHDQLTAESMEYLNVEAVSDRHVIIWGRKC